MHGKIFSSNFRQKLYVGYSYFGQIIAICMSTLHIYMKMWKYLNISYTTNNLFSPLSVLPCFHVVILTKMNNGGMGLEAARQQKMPLEHEEKQSTSWKTRSSQTFNICGKFSANDELKSILNSTTCRMQCC